MLSNSKTRGYLFIFYIPIGLFLIPELNLKTIVGLALAIIYTAKLLSSIKSPYPVIPTLVLVLSGISSESLFKKDCGQATMTNQVRTNNK